VDIGLSRQLSYAPNECGTSCFIFDSLKKNLLSALRDASATAFLARACKGVAVGKAVETVEYDSHDGRLRRLALMSAEPMIGASAWKGHQSKDDE